ncbi:hypothetical protein COUCH_36035 [Couchioplanes caeruleus]|uniref:hypothetical protein n=1 Tax=Couchioplanes caeruleus TaxID=56438 RepID=UPI0020C06C5D|nr:hypothetical protein [Couchioplanes caeruleus]UQU64311.1 hypothetical protein COUCH_36035 [Couchioplanes caeruleus]
MPIDSPPSHQVSRYVIALLLIAAFAAVIVGLVLAGVDTSATEGGRRIIEEVRTAWRS